MSFLVNLSRNAADKIIMLKRLRFAEFIAISLVLHGLVVLLLAIPHSKPKPQEVTIEIVTPPESTPKAVAQAEPVPKVQPQKEVQAKQIVEQEEKKTNEEAPDTRFLSAQNQKVQKQTVAREKGEFQNSKKHAASKKPVPRQNWNLAPKLNAASEPVADEGLKKAEKAQDSSDQPEHQAEEMADGSRSSDYLKDVDQGLETMLNTKEFKYYTYYNRIRRQLSQYWEPKVRSKLSQMFRQGRTIAASTDRVTKLIVVLDRTGSLVKVQVIKESGVTDLDEAATEAFQSAAPFPNPPAGIIEPDGTVKIRWDFVLES